MVDIHRVTEIAEFARQSFGHGHRPVLPANATERDSVPGECFVERSVSNVVSQRAGEDVRLYRRVSTVFPDALALRIVQTAAVEDDRGVLLPPLTEQEREGPDLHEIR